MAPLNKHASILYSELPRCFGIRLLNYTQSRSDSGLYSHSMSLKEKSD